MADEPTLRSGDTGDWVTYLQQLLEYRGVGGGFSAGTFDDATQNAVVQIQQRGGLNPTGVCESDTWAALTATSSASTTPASTTPASTATDDPAGTPGDIAVSIQDEVAAPDGEIALSELEPLPATAVS
ncbi:MAG: peptidoglycan-binding protein [Catenulispora sp.]